MSSKIEVDLQMLKDLHEHPDCPVEFIDHLRRAITAPVVERQPVAEVQHGPFDDVGAPQWVRVATLGDFDLENFPDGTKFYTAPPELAELQATIAQLKDELGAAKGEYDRSANKVAQLQDEIERLKGGQGDVQMAAVPVERCYDVRAKMIIAFNEARKNGGDLDDGLDAAYKTALRYSPSEATQPAPVSVVYPSVDEVMKLVMNYQENIRTNVTGTTNWAASIGMHIIDKVKELNQ